METTGKLPNRIYRIYTENRYTTKKYDTVTLEEAVNTIHAGYNATKAQIKEMLLNGRHLSSAYCIFSKDRPILYPNI